MAGVAAHEETPGRPQVSSSPTGGLTRSGRSGGAPSAIARRCVTFGAEERRMVGIYHYPRPTEPGGRAALLCNPFGQEAVRAHRIFVVLADRLAQLGVPTLRFDYHGTGDSPGDDAAGDLHGWTQDIVSAQQKLESLARPSESVWMGLRLGALLAASAAARRPSPLAALILWEPVLDGRAYLRELGLADHRALLQAFSLNRSMRRELRREPPAEDPAEALGFALSPALREQLRGAADGKAFQQTGGTRTTVITSRRTDAQQFQGLMAAAGNPPPVIHHLDLQVDWATNDAGGGTIAPAGLVRLVVPLIVEGAG